MRPTDSSVPALQEPWKTILVPGPKRHVFRLGKDVDRREFCRAPGCDSRAPRSDPAAPNSEEEPGFPASGRAGPCQQRPHLPGALPRHAIRQFLSLVSGNAASAVFQEGRGGGCCLFYSHPRPRAWHRVTSRNPPLAWATLTLFIFFFINPLTQLHFS